MVAAPSAPKSALSKSRWFPVPLVCPGCAQPFDEEDSCACATPRLEWWHGLPRTLFGQSYWGETSQANMHRVLDLLDTTPWREALRQVAGDEAVYHHLTSDIGPDFVYGMPWDKIRTVLEIGPGMGLMTAPLAKFAEQVVALEAVPERALFLAQRAKQDGLDNIHPIIASGTALPFAPESFDLIALNGVFEYIGLWGEGDPEALQQQFLERASRLLRPGGYIYIGIETRFGLGAWLGSRDHSGHRFTSLMPRRAADWYCRRRRVPFYGSANALDGYRTYTHSPRKYARMLTQAGFGTVDVFGCHDGYNRQIGLASLANYTAWKKTRSIVDTPCSLLGTMRRLISHNRVLFRALENEVVVFGCKDPDAGQLFWSSLGAPGPITQLSTAQKVNALLFEGGRVTAIATAAKRESAQAPLEHSHRVLRRAQALLGEEIDKYAVRWPRPLGTKCCHGLDVFEWEFAEGDLLSKLLLPRNYHPGRFARIVQQLTQGYVHLTARLTEALAPEPTLSCAALLKTWSAIRLGDSALNERLQAACRNLGGRDWRLQVVHGDLTFNNVIQSPSGQLILLDWDNVAEEGLPAIDLVRLLYDAWMDSKIFRPRQALEFLANVRAGVQAALASLGFGAGDFGDLEMLFVAHQHQYDHSRHCEVETMLRAYGDPSFTLLKG